MTTAVGWSDLVRCSDLARHGWHVAGVFQSGSATYNVVFHAEAELVRFLDFVLSAAEPFATSKLYRRASSYPYRPEYDLSGMRFQFDTRHQVAAAAVLADDHDADHLYRWVTRGDSGRTDVVLAHDSWHEHGTVFPPEAFITVPQLREALVQWAFGDVLPPPAIRWAQAPDDLGWL